VPTPAAQPTFGPGQYFEEDDPNKPDFDRDTIQGNHEFGYAQLTENPEFFAVWVTDEDGTHYLIVDMDCQIMTGGPDPNSGFFNIIRNIDSKYTDIQQAERHKDTHENSASSFRWGETIAAIAWGGCVVLTEGLCLPLVGIFGGLAGLSLNKDNDAQIEEDNIEIYRQEIEDFQNDLNGLFVIGQAIYGNP